jgi:hypothetical protein
MKIKLILLHLLFISNLALSQSSGLFIASEINEHFSCNINLFADGMYGITLTEHKYENPHVLIISYGKYSIKDKLITLPDSYNGYRMIFSYTKNKLIGLQTFSWLQNVKFDYWDYGIENEEYFKNDNSSNLRKNIIQFNQENKPINTLYFKEYNQAKFNFCLQRPHSYKFSYNGFLISEGTFKRGGNQLILYDPALNFSFYALVGKEYLFCKILPIDYNGYKFNILKSGINTNTSGLLLGK